jgi:hypothetical protein
MVDMLKQLQKIEALGVKVGELHEKAQAAIEEAHKGLKLLTDTSEALPYLEGGDLSDVLAFMDHDHSAALKALMSSLDKDFSFGEKIASLIQKEKKLQAQGGHEDDEHGVGQWAKWRYLK